MMMINVRSKPDTILMSQTICLIHIHSNSVLALIFACPKSNLEKFSIDSSKFFPNFHLFESSFTCTRLWESGLVQKPEIFVCMDRSTL